MMSTTPRETFEKRARSVANVTGWDLEQEREDRGWSAIGLGPVGQHRDSSALDRSNFEVILSALKHEFGDTVADVRFGHWGFGWVEEIIFDAGNDAVVAEVERWEVALADYPVADESHLSGLEYEEACESIGQTSTYCHVDGVDYELRDDLPGGWESEVFGALGDAGEDTSPEGLREDAVLRAMIRLGLFVAEVQS